MATLGELRERAAYQFGMDAEDIAELEPGLTGYLNEGYSDVLLRFYKPWREEMLDTANGAIPYAQLKSRPIHVLSARVNGAEARAVVMDEAQQLVRVLGVPAEATVLLRYQYLPRPMEESDDIPKLPEWVHAALADWATWRLYTNGNPQKQSRGQAFRQAYEDKARRLKPFGVDMLENRRWRGLYTEG